MSNPHDMNLFVNSLPVHGGVRTVSVTFARPAPTTAYIAGDVVSNSTSATVLMEFAGVPGQGAITAARLATNKKSITPRFRVHLYGAADPAVAVDNLPHKELWADNSKRRGYFDLPAMATAPDTSGSDLSRAVDMNLAVPFTVTGSLYALLETLDGFTPDNGQQFSLALTFEG